MYNFNLAPSQAETSTGAGEEEPMEAEVLLKDDDGLFSLSQLVIMHMQYNLRYS